jgi:hypothetical protein
MTRRVLSRHPDFPCQAVTSLVVEAVRPAAGVLEVRFILEGSVGDIALAPASLATRAARLWRTTCFEVFVRPAPGQAYAEFNLAPSGASAAYRFDAYRAGMADAESDPPRVRRTGDARSLEIAATLHAPLAGEAPWDVGLSAVIEEVGGRISYWALAHPPGRPDFHHPDCFALELAAPL